MDEIWMVGFIINPLTNDWELAIELWFANTLGQSKAMYKHDISFSQIQKLTGKGWKFIPDFIISHMQKQLVNFKIPMDSEKGYIEYWKSHYSLLGQKTKSELPEFLKKLQDEKIIIITTQNEEDLEKKIYSTQRTPLNISASFGLRFAYSSDDASKLDKNGTLAQEMKERIK